MSHQLTLASLLLLAAAAAVVIINPQAALSELTTWTLAVGLATAFVALVASIGDDERKPMR
jgi:hypothetical protein